MEEHCSREEGILARADDGDRIHLCHPRTDERESCRYCYYLSFYLSEFYLCIFYSFSNSIFLDEKDLSEEFKAIFKEGFPKDWQKKLTSVQFTSSIQASGTVSKTSRSSSAKGKQPTPSLRTSSRKKAEKEKEKEKELEQEKEEKAKEAKEKEKDKKGKGEEEEQRDEDGTESEDEDELFLHKLPEDMSDKQIRAVLKKNGLNATGTRKQLNARLRRRLAAEKKRREKESQQKDKQEAEEQEKEKDKEEEEQEKEKEAEGEGIEEATTDVSEMVPEEEKEEIGRAHV